MDLSKTKANSERAVIVVDIVHMIYRWLAGRWELNNAKADCWLAKTWHMILQWQKQSGESDRVYQWLSEGYLAIQVSVISAPSKKPHTSYELKILSKEQMVQDTESQLSLRMSIWRAFLDNIIFTTTSINFTMWNLKRLESFWEKHYINQIKSMKTNATHIKPRQISCKPIQTSANQFKPMQTKSN